MSLDYLPSAELASWNRMQTFEDRTWTFITLSLASSAAWNTEASWCLLNGIGFYHVTVQDRKIMIFKKFARQGTGGKSFSMREGFPWAILGFCFLIPPPQGKRSGSSDWGVWDKEGLTFRHGPSPAAEAWEPLPNPVWGKLPVAMHPSHIFHGLCFFWWVQNSGVEKVYDLMVPQTSQKNLERSIYSLTS